MLRTIIKATFHFPETESTKADGEEAGDLESDVTSREDADSPTTNSTFATTEGGALLCSSEIVRERTDAMKMMLQLAKMSQCIEQIESAQPSKTGALKNP